MIVTQDIVTRLNASLDAEGSDRYTFDQDFAPAINSSIEWLVSVFNRVFADRKYSEENLRELIRVRVWATSEFSRFAFNPTETGDQLWSIIKIMPKPIVHPGTAIPPTSEPFESTFFGQTAFISGKYSAERLTTEQWEENIDNIFEAGNTTLSGSLIRYAYKSPVDYTTSAYTPGGSEIEIRPTLNRELIAMEYLSYPNPVSDISDNISLPSSLINLIFEKALNFISYKQGDRTNLYSVTEKDVQALIQLLS